MYWGMSRGRREAGWPWRALLAVLVHTPPPPETRTHTQALAQRSHCFFLNVTASTVLSKWLGDANRLIKAIFTLAHKLQPCIIFIGEPPRKPSPVRGMSTTRPGGAYVAASLVPACRQALLEQPVMR